MRTSWVQQSNNWTEIGMIPLDSETCGFHGPAVIFQYAYDRDNVIIHEIWFEPIKATLELIEEICEQGVMAYNLAFDWFHVQKLYNCLDLLGQKVGDNERPIDHINLFAELEPQARDGLCIKPSTALDLMLYARKGPFQSLMDRKNITIKRVPKELAAPLAQELENRIVLKDIYFEKSHRKGNRWEILPVKQADGKDHPYLVDIKLKFKPSTSLKSLAYHALGRDRGTRLKLKDVEPDERPYEVAWAPFALAVSNKDQGWAIPEKKNGKTVYKKRAWPAMILDHALHWRHVSKAREYAKDDITDLLDLYDYFGQPEPGDDDSILACMMGSIRWKGYRINTDKMK